MVQKLNFGQTQFTLIQLRFSSVMVSNNRVSFVKVDLLSISCSIFLLGSSGSVNCQKV